MVRWSDGRGGRGDVEGDFGGVGFFRIGVGGVGAGREDGEPDASAADGAVDALAALAFEGEKVEGELGGVEGGESGEGGDGGSVGVLGEFRNAKGGEGRAGGVGLRVQADPVGERFEPGGTAWAGGVEADEESGEAKGRQHRDEHGVAGGLTDGHGAGPEAGVVMGLGCSGVKCE